MRSRAPTVLRVSININPPVPAPVPATNRVPRHFDANSFREAALGVGLAPELVEAALRRLRAGEVIGLAVSGKIASGKDTVAPMVLDQLGYSPAEHLFFAKALKAEFDRMVAILRAEADPVLAAVAISEQLNIPADQAELFVVRLFEHVRSDSALNAYSRTPEIRWGLQYLGTDVRRAQDTDYWVKRALVPAVSALAAGRSVFFTDCRFPNEVDGSRRVGFLTARLEVSQGVQRARLEQRDGKFDPSAFLHASECALDDYESFDVVVDNDHDLLSTVAATAEALRAHSAAITAS